MRSDNAKPTNSDRNDVDESNANRPIDDINKNDDDEDQDSRIGAYCTLRSKTYKDGGKSEEMSYKNNRANDYPNYCTLDRKLLRSNQKSNILDNCYLPYKQLENVAEKDSPSLSSSSSASSSTSFAPQESSKLSFDNCGLSNDLSRESIKNACDYYEFSDDENFAKISDPIISNANGSHSSILEKIGNQISSLKRSSLRGSCKSVTFDRSANKTKQFHPYCTMRRGNQSKSLEKLSKALPKRSLSKLSSDLPSEDQCHIENYSNIDSLEALNILSELDAILKDHEIPGDSQPASFSSISLHSSEPEKVEDCLLELDAYLDEIDRISGDNSINYMKSIEYGNDMTIQQNHNNERQQEEAQLKRYRIFNDLLTMRKQQRNSKDFQRHCQTLPMKMNSKRINRVACEADGKSQDTLERGCKFRSTIGATRSPCGDSSCGSSTMAREKRVKQHNRNLSWRRNSMRKTSPIELPDQQSEPISAATSTDNSSTESPSTSLLNDALIVPPSVPLPQDNSTTSNENGCDAKSEPAEECHLRGQRTNPREVNEDLRRCLSQVDYNYRNELVHLDIINDILNASQESHVSSTNGQQPRQMGRRAEAHPRVVSIMSETNSTGNQRIIVNHDRPLSAPAIPNRRNAITTALTNTRSIENHRNVSSEPSSVFSSRNPSPVSIVSTASSSMFSASAEQSTDSARPQNQTSDADDSPEEHIETSKALQWPHGFSRPLALLCCTLGLFNISRFSLFSIHFGANFLVQFLILSIVFGIPMLWLQMCLGAKIRHGPITMWKISPICKGIGISLVLGQCVVALYSTIGLGWILVYFRDSFVSRNERYRWQEAFELYRGPGNSSNKLAETIADYFNGVVLQRLQLGPGRVNTGGVRFQLAFNLAILWTLVFIVLCRGLKSFGKIVLGLTLLPIILFLAVSSKLLYLIDFTSVQNIFPATDWPDFFLNSRSWLSAAQETFLTWGLLGASVISISSKSAEKCEGKTILRRDALLVVIMTLFGLFMAAVFGNACIQILRNNGYLYFPGSYEQIDTYTFLYPTNAPVAAKYISTPPKWLPRYSTVMGENFRRPGMNPLKESGYQALRIVTEVFPATLAAATQELISPIWSLLGFLTLLMFGLAQLCAMWKPISSALGASTSSVLLSCITGLLLGIPLATEMGITIIHYLDILLGGAWWVLILWSAQIFAIFLIRGRPYNGDHLVGDLKLTQTLSAFLALSWTVLLPIGLIALAIIEYKASNTREFFHWHGNSYFHMWARKVGSFLQVSFLLLIPIVSVIQIYRYLSKGPPDILVRIQMLYRPSQSCQSNLRDRIQVDGTTSFTNPSSGGVTIGNIESQRAHEDAPPKYTPPPSYTTATGARLAKMFRQSIRRSVRRILGETSRPRPSIPLNSTASVDQQPPNDNSLPPAYSTVLINPAGDDSTSEMGPRVLYNSHTQRTLSLERNRQRPSAQIQPDSDAASVTQRNAATFTAFDVAQLLRSSGRHERSASTIGACVDHVLKTSSLKRNHSRSAENLVLNAAPLGESSAVTLNVAESINSDENTSVI